MVIISIMVALISAGISFYMLRQARRQIAEMTEALLDIDARGLCHNDGGSCSLYGIDG